MSSKVKEIEANFANTLRDAKVLCTLHKYEEVLTSLESIDINGLINLLLDLKDYNEMESSMINDIVYVLHDLYNNGGMFTSPVPDDLYSMIYSVYIENGGKELSGSEVNLELGAVTNHKYTALRGTIAKIHYVRTVDRPANDKRRTLEQFIDTTNNALGGKLKDYDTTVIATLKKDGDSTVFECDAFGKVQKALLRGNTTQNEANDISRYFKDINFAHVIPRDKFNKNYGLKCELIMTDENFIKAKKIYPFTNNLIAVSGTINSTTNPNPELLKLITPVPLQVQYEGSDCTEIPDWVYENCMWDEFNILDLDKAQEVFKRFNVQAQLKGIPADGVVLRFKDKALQKALGREGAVNKFEIAYKFPPFEKKALLRDVEFQVGLLGNISAVAKIEPIIMKGNTIKSINVGSIPRLEKLKLRRGSEVIIKYSVVPYLDTDNTCDVSDEPIIHGLDNCPLCGHELVLDPVLKCNNLECPGRKIGKIVNYAKKMNIKNISVGVVTALVNAKVLSNIEDLYNINKMKNLIADMSGFGERSVEILISSVKAVGSVYEYELLGALAIPNVGRRKFKSLCTVYTMEELFKIAEKFDYKAITKVKGFGEGTARLICMGLNLNKKTVNEVLKNVMVKKAEIHNKFACFTGIRDAKLAKALEDAGYEVLDSFRSDVTLLIVPDDEGFTSGTLKKALKINAKNPDFSLIDISPITQARLMFHIDE